MAFDFAPDRRLRRHSEFVRAQRTGRRVGTPHFTLLVSAHWARYEALRPSRLGLVVPRKVGSAVRRNRVKRVCRECFRLWPGLLPGGVDLIVIARAGAADLGLAEVRAEWRTAEPVLRRHAAEALARTARSDHSPADETSP